MKIKNKKFVIFVFVVFIFVSLLIFALVQNNSRPNLKISFLDVGQGDAALIEAPEGQRILIDAGPDKKVLRELGHALWPWQRDIDLVILSHLHEDHVGGLADILRYYDVGRVVYSGETNELKTLSRISGLLESHQIGFAIANKRQEIDLGQGCRLLLYAPDRSGSESENNLSLLSYLDCLGHTALFLGDAEKEQDGMIKSLGFRPEIMKIAHHGSDTGTSEDLLASLRPKIAVISVGLGNKLGHPSRRVLKRLERVGAQIHRTDLEHAIAFKY